MASFYDDPYECLEEAFNALNDGEAEEAQAHALIAIAIALLGAVENDDVEPDDTVPAGPILYEDYPGGD